MIEIPIRFLSDSKGYVDRQCPNENCLYTFKINMNDWKEKVSDEEVHCPMCGHVDVSDKWWTQEQVKAMQNIVSSYAMSLASEKIGQMFENLARSTKNNKSIHIEYIPGQKITFINNPIGQREDWETDITCEECGTKYSVIGSAYFCPCCGYNSAISVFDETLDNIEKMLKSIPELKEVFTKSYGKDKAETMSRSLLESSFGDIVSAFQKFAERIYKRKTTLSVRVNDFQIVDKGSQLFFDATGKGYDEWLSKNEIDRMNVLFQRRHIIEHNSGIVDERYLKQSKDNTYVLGQHLVVHMDEAVELINIIKKLSAGLKTL